MIARKWLPVLVPIFLCGWSHDFGRAGDRNREGVTIGLTPAGTYTPDLDVPIRRTGPTGGCEVILGVPVQLHRDTRELPALQTLKFLEETDQPVAAQFLSFSGSRDAVPINFSIRLNAGAMTGITVPRFRAKPVDSSGERWPRFHLFGVLPADLPAKEPEPSREAESDIGSITDRDGADVESLASQFPFELLGVLPVGPSGAERKLASQLRFCAALARIDAPVAATFTSFQGARDAAYASSRYLRGFPCRVRLDAGAMAGITVSWPKP